MVTVTCSVADKFVPEDGELIAETPISFAFKCVTSAENESFVLSWSVDIAVLAVIEYVVPTEDISVVAENVNWSVKADPIVPVYVSVIVAPPSTWYVTSKFEASFSP